MYIYICQSQPSNTSHPKFLKNIYMVFKGCIPFTVITKFWLYPPCCTIHPYNYLIPNSSYLGSIKEEFVNFYLCILKSCFLKMDSLFSYVLATHLGQGKNIIKPNTSMTK